MIQGLFVLTQFLIHSSLAFVPQASAPDCLDNSGKNITINNAQVIEWKTSTPYQFLARGHVEGIVRDIYPDHTGHHHFAIDLDSNPNDSIEVIYNVGFGELPAIKIGMKVEACGDYITSNAPTGQYQASPNGAIIHWVHRNPKPQGHKSGFLVIDGALYGQGNGTPHL